MHLNKTKILFGPVINKRMTRASSQNVGKFYRTVIKLSEKNLHLFMQIATENDVTSDMHLI